MRLTFLYKLNHGKPLFLNLRCLRHSWWPLTTREASLLFGPELRVLDLPSPYNVMRIGNPGSRSEQWGRLSQKQQHQICVFILNRRSPRFGIPPQNYLDFFGIPIPTTHPSPISLFKDEKDPYLADATVIRCLPGCFPKRVEYIFVWLT